VIEEAGQHENELNPYWKTGDGTGKGIMTADGIEAV